MTPPNSAPFAKARRLFPHTKTVVYFNSASYGPFSIQVAKAINDNVALRLAADKDDSHEAFETHDLLRRDIAKLIGARKREIGVALSTTFGLNIATHGLPLKAGDEVLLSDCEFPASVYAWKAAAKARGLTIRYIPSLQRCFDPQAFLRMIGPRTKVLSVSWVQFFNGYKIDLTELSDLCSQRGIYLVVDAIQGMGAEPVNMQNLKIDILSAGCQKWMLAPQGCGFFYLSDRVRDTLTPPFMSWLGADWKLRFDDLFHYQKPLFDSARRFEMGYYAVLNILGLKAAVDLISGLGLKQIQRHNYQLIDRLVAYLEDSEFYRVTSPLEPCHRSSILTFTGPRLKELHRHLLKQRIICVRREGSIRISVHLFNNASDIDRLIRSLEKFKRLK